MVLLSFVFLLSCENRIQNEENTTKDVVIASKEELIKQHLLVKAQYESLNDIIVNLDFGFTRCSYPELKFIDINNECNNE